MDASRSGAASREPPASRAECPTYLLLGAKRPRTADPAMRSSM